jgi:hypothetical protein
MSRCESVPMDPCSGVAQAPKRSASAERSSGTVMKLPK